jgi:YjbE family integral membrane protein
VDFLFTDLMQPAFWFAAGQIILINVVLSGDNAVVIALACRTLPPRQRFWGMILGAGIAVLLRIIFTIFVAQAMKYPYVALVGGALLFWVAIKLVVPEEEGEGKIEAAENLWRAVRIVAIADIIMSLDNVIAIAGAAKLAGLSVDPAHASAIEATLIIFGLATSIPLIIAGSALLMAALDRYPILIWAGAALLGWVAGDIMVKDAALASWLSADFIEMLHHAPLGFSLPWIGPVYVNWMAVAGGIFVVAVGLFIRRLRHKKALAAPLIIDPPGPEEFPHRHPEKREKVDR